MTLGQRRRSGWLAEIRRPLPVPDLGHIFQMLSNVVVVFVQLSIEHVDHVRSIGTKPGDILQGVDGDVIAAHFVQHDHVEWGGGCALIHKAAHMEASLVGAAMNHAVNEPAIVVEGENNVHSFGEERIEGHVVHAMRVIVRAHQRT